MSDRLKQLSEAGVSIWLDDLSRERLETGNLADLKKNSSVVGITSNPSIFAKALEEGERYDEQVRELVGQGADLDAVVEELTTTDVRNACDVFLDVFEATDGVDGRVSIEVNPGLAHQTEATVRQAAELWHKVDRPNLYIKIPGTEEGWPAIAETLGAGIPVNVTLIFGLDQYHHVMEAYVDGLEQARDDGHDTVQAPLGGLVLRLPRGHRDRQAARGRRRAPPSCSARPGSPTPGSPTRRSRSSSSANAGRPSWPPARTRSDRCGRPPG